MAIESIDRIERMSVSAMPYACEAIGQCGMIFRLSVRPAMMINGEIVLWTVTDIDSGWSEAYGAEKEFNVLVPDTLDDPITQAEIVLALHDKGIDF